MGGGTSLIEANRLGCSVVGYDISPMSHWIVRQVFESIDIPRYLEAATNIKERVRARIGRFYQTTCQSCLRSNADAKYFLWVRVKQCNVCNHRFDSFRNNLIATSGRHPTNVFVCPTCGEITETNYLHGAKCRPCQTTLSASSRGELVECPNCHGREFDAAPPRYRLFAIEYHCSLCKPAHRGRFFKKPDATDLARSDEVNEIWHRTRPRFVPTDEIVWGPETNRLRKYGYRRYRDLFNERQLLSLELTAREISRLPDQSIRRALFTNLSDLLRYQNMLCRYDVKSLKSLDIFSFHGFPINMVHCESNFLGILGSNPETVIGSGGWSNIVEKYRKAKLFCGSSYEIRHQNGNRTKITGGEWIGQIGTNGASGVTREVKLRCQSSAKAKVRANSLDAVLTDPPYLNNVRYSDLMDFCGVWLARFVPEYAARRRIFLRTQLREPQESELVEYALTLQDTFQRFAGGLKSGGLFVFTFHHNRLEVYAAVIVALLNARLRCTYSFPCPSEMSASIHILRRNASRVDMIFVCRKIGVKSRPFSPSLSLTLKTYSRSLERVGLTIKPADKRSILYGLAACLSVARLEKEWQSNRSINQSLQEVTDDLRRTVRGVKG